LYSQDDKSGFFQRNQKKIRQLKRDIDYLTSENGKLKVEIESLKAGQVRLVYWNWNWFWFENWFGNRFLVLEFELELV
jgi:hypothetical protein